MDLVGNIVPILLFDKLDEFLLEFEEHDKEVYGGVIVDGPAAAYAEVWEWGNVRQTKPGPRTVIGTNPRGEMVWLSSQAPFGYIRIHESEFWAIFQDELRKAKFSGQPNAAAMTQELEKVSKRAAKKMAIIIRESVPVDSGELRSDIIVADPRDPLLTIEEDFGPLVIEETGE